ncbi:HEAT repeat domain-containing protein [Myxococcota bacterium]
MASSGDTDERDESRTSGEPIRERPESSELDGIRGEPPLVPSDELGPSRQSQSVISVTPVPEEAPPEIDVGADEMDEHWLVEDGPSSPNGKAPLAPTSRYVQHAARTPRPSQLSHESELPSIIVDVERECLTLLDRVLAGDEKARLALEQLGPPAARVLAARLPGPLTPGRASVPPSRIVAPSRCGPLLGILVGMGQTAVEPLAERSTDPDPNVRAWATRLLGELPWPESAWAILPRLADENEEVRQSALTAGRMLETDQPSWNTLLDALLGLLRDAEQPVEVRSWAVTTLGALRMVRSIGALIELLSDANTALVQEVYRALMVLTAQDFGPSRLRFSVWWNEHRHRHRIEWLIDALTHESAGIRQSAAEDLTSVTKEYFGYYDDLPPKERARAQQRYREWWHATGQTLFR